MVEQSGHENPATVDRPDSVTVTLPIKEVVQEVARTICEGLYPGIPPDVVGWETKFSDKAKAIWYEAVTAGLKKYQELHK